MGKIRARTAIGWRTFGDSFAAMSSASLSIVDAATFSLGGRNWVLKKSGNYLTSLDLVNGTGLKAVLSTTSSTINVGTAACPIVWKNISDFTSEKQAVFRFAARFVPSSPGANTEVCGIAVTGNSATWGGQSYIATLGTIGGAAGGRHIRNAGATATNSATLAGSFNCLMTEFRAGCARHFVATSPDIVPLPDSSAWTLLSTTTSDAAGSSHNNDAASGEGFHGAVGVGFVFGNGNVAGGQTMICTGYKLSICDNFSLQVT